MTEMWRAAHELARQAAQLCPPQPRPAWETPLTGYAIGLLLLAVTLVTFYAVASRRR